MKFKVLLFIALSSHSIHAATSKINLGIGQLRDASGTVIDDGGGTWAIIVSQIPEAPPTAGALPGGLANNSSLSEDNPNLIFDVKSSFDNVELSVGQPTGKDFYIWKVGGFSGGNDLGLNGAVETTIEFDVFSSPDPGFSAGALWGFYWFPGQSIGSVLTGNYQVGGFANDVNVPSGGETGTTVPSATSIQAGNFFETELNQNAFEGGDTGLSAARFTAVAIPEPSAVLIALLGFTALMRRRRV